MAFVSRNEFVHHKLLAAIKSKKYCYKIYTFTHVILEDQMANDIQQSTLIVLEGSGLYIELDLMVFGTIELILVG